MSETASYYATGRRKGAIARVWLFAGQKGIVINDADSREYLQRASLQLIVEQPFKSTQLGENFKVKAHVHGGGKAGQAGAVRLGISRALLAYDEKLRSLLRKSGFLTRDPRKKERKKPGRKSARRSFQYTKR